MVMTTQLQISCAIFVTLTKLNTKVLEILHQTLKVSLKSLNVKNFVKNIEVIEDDKQSIIRVFLEIRTKHGERVITNLSVFQTRSSCLL